MGDEEHTRGPTGDGGGADDGAVVVSFHGVRGSTPCSCPTLQRYGGNTSCVSVETAGHEPFVFDLGTGLRPWGRAMSDPTGMKLHALVSHLHWDHIQGLPFFAPLLCPDTTMHVYGPGENGETLADAFARFMAPPFFPISSEQLPSTVEFHDAHDDDMVIGEARVMARPVPHTGTTNGFRVNLRGVSVAYIPDHQEPIGRPQEVVDSVLELCDGVDILIHDAQLWSDELAIRHDWGHCTPEYAVEVARQAGAKSLVLFHHDPGHDDDELDEMHDRLADAGAAAGLDSVVTAAEGLKLTLDPR